MIFFFASDLHGSERRYDALVRAAECEQPDAILLGGDLLPSSDQERFIERMALNRVVAILGNDDPRYFAEALGERFTVIHNRWIEVNGVRIYGYPFVPPTPFALKDWERYDVSHYVDPGCISPEDGVRSVPVDPHEARYATIERDLQALAGDEDVGDAVFLFHAPPYRTTLDRAAVDGRFVDHVPLDPHVGSIAVRRFIESRQPRVTLHGHVHESVRLTGRWSDRIDRTVLLGAAHDGPELALVRFDPTNPETATRELL